MPQFKRVSRAGTDVITAEGPVADYYKRQPNWELVAPTEPSTPESQPTNPPTTKKSPRE